jgi:predicted chitinase
LPTTAKPSTNTPIKTPTVAPPAGSSLARVLSELQGRSATIDNQVLRYQQPDLSWVPSTVYKSADMIAAVRVMASSGAGGMKLDVGSEQEGAKAYRYGLANLAAFLAQAKKESIQYNACDENSWDLVNGVYPLSNACGQLGQSYQDYVEDPATDCPLDPSMEIVATTNAKWYGAPPPLKCAPRAKSGPTVGWSYSASCGPWGPPTPLCNVYPGQQGGAFTTAKAASSTGRTDTENCCWWGRGVIQSTGRANYGKLNYYLGAKAAARGAAAPYGDVDFCKTPDAVCSSTAHPELKWIAGFFYWISSVQTYATSEFNYSQRLRAFVDGGFTDTTFIDAVSGIVNRGCPRTTCSSGAVDGLEDRRANFALTLSSLGLTSSGGRRLRSELLE